MGMDEGVLEHSLDPFFTTKDQGTGIGLSQVRAFIRNNGGIERITSAARKGTTVRLYLPEAARRRS
jgi:signal transduction histidine kinase